MLPPWITKDRKDPYWERRLRQYDAQLNLRWDNRKNRWVVTRTTRPQGEPDEHIVFYVRHDDGAYAHPSQKVLDDLAWADAWRRGQQALREIEARNEAAAAALEKQAVNDVQDMAKERHRYVATEANDVLGATNIPRQDLQAEVERTIAERPLHDRARRKRRA